WVVLPQGMKNSPTICQMFVHAALQPVRERYPDVVIIHYMDDLLFASACLPPALLTTIRQVLARFGLAIGEEKTQTVPPFKYLGTELSPRIVKPQKL
ncbi:hypothetical protein FK515_30410, partial [Klebsiella pneumoniae]|nr:hypothetical protein [Klebsiella pneumoniae]